MGNNSNDAIDILDKCSRYRFQEHDFLPQWKAIQKFVKYRSIGDYTYGDRRRFTSARHLQECLDQVAIPTLRSIFQPDVDDDEDVEENDDDLIQLRRLVCAEMEDVIEATLAEATMSDDEVDDDDQHDDEAPRVETTSTAPPTTAPTSHWNADQDIACATKRGRRAQKADYGRSAISYDAGTDQYLQRKKNKKRRTVVAVGTAAAVSMSNDNNKEAAHVVSSTLKETVAHAQALDTSECEKIETAYATSEFDRWKFLLYTDHALILYGNGSKRTIVNTFCDDELQPDGGILQVDAIDVHVSAASIIALLANLFHCRDSESSVTRSLPLIAQADRVGKQIQRRCQETHDAVFLVIYNLECILQRHPTDWKAIVKLAEHVRVLATVDDVDAPSYMSPCCTSFVWIAVHTQRPYVRELAKLEWSDEEQSRQSIRARQRELSESRILEVLRNLAPRYAQVMEVLAQLQLQVRGVVDRTTAAAAAANDDTGWVNYKDFREACKSNCLTDKQLRTLQTELKEHGLMVDKIDATGEYVRIPFGVEKLQAIQNYKGTLPKKTN